MKVGLEPTTWVLNMTLLYHLSYFIHCEPAGPMKDTTGSDCYVSKFCVPPRTCCFGSGGISLSAIC